MRLNTADVVKVIKKCEGLGMYPGKPIKNDVLDKLYSVATDLLEAREVLTAINLESGHGATAPRAFQGSALRRINALTVEYCGS